MIAGTGADTDGSTASHATINRSTTNPHRRMWSAKAFGKSGRSTKGGTCATVADPDSRAGRREGDPPVRADLANRRRLDIGEGLCSSLERYVFSRIGRKRVCEITTADVLGVIVPMAHQDRDGTTSEGPHLHDHEYAKAAR